MVDFAQCSRVQYLKQSSKVSTVVRSQALKKLSFSTKRLEKKKKVLIVFWDIWREGGGYQFMNVLSENK